MYTIRINTTYKPAQISSKITPKLFLNLLMIKTFDLGLEKIADAFEKRANELFNRA